MPRTPVFLVIQNGFGAAMWQREMCDGGSEERAQGPEGVEKTRVTRPGGTRTRFCQVAEA